MSSVMWFRRDLRMRDNPALREVPLAVGGRHDQRGVVATCNYEARRYGIHSLSLIHI